MSAPGLPPVPPLTKLGFADPVWAKWLGLLRQNIVASVAAVQIQTANGFNGTVAVVGGVAQLTIGTSVTGLLKGTGGGVVAAVAGTDYLVANQPITLTGDVTGGPASSSIATTLAASGVTAGAYGSATVIPQITVDAKGRVTLITNVAVAIPSALSGNTASRPATGVVGTTYFDTTLSQPVWIISLGPTTWVNSAGVVV